MFSFILYKKVIFATVPNRVSKAFNCIPPYFLVTKFSDYDFDNFGLYIGLRKENRNHKTTNGSPSSDLQKTLFDDPKGCNLGSISFIIS